MTLVEWVYLGLRAVVAYIFISYGISKLQDVAAFTANIRKYNILPSALPAVIARILPPLEIGLGLLLLFDLAILPTAIATMGLLVLFSIAIAWTTLGPRFSTEDCGCGNRTKVTPKGALTRNCILFFALYLISTLSAGTLVLGFNWLSLISETTILMFVLIRTLQPLRLVRLLSVLQTVKQHNMISRTPKSVQEASPVKNLSTRRTFIRGASAFGAGIMALALFGTPNKVLADTPFCTCNYSSPCSTMRNVSCSCCNSCQSTCIGSVSNWDIYCCADGSGQHCDVLYRGTEPVVCICG